MGSKASLLLWNWLVTTPLVRRPLGSVTESRKKADWVDLPTSNEVRPIP